MSLTHLSSNVTSQTSQSYQPFFDPLLSVHQDSFSLEERQFDRIDSTKPGNRLIETEEGEIHLIQKTPWEVADEKLLRPIVDRVIMLGSKLSELVPLSLPEKGWKGLTGALSRSSIGQKKVTSDLTCTVDLGVPKRLCGSHRRITRSSSKRSVTKLPKEQLLVEIYIRVGL